MIKNPKTKEELIEELAGLRLENESLKTLYEQDITKRKNEEALGEKEELFQSLYKNSSVGLYRTTPDGQILLANPCLIKMLGYSTFKDLAARDLRKDGFESSFNRNLFLEQIEKNGEVTSIDSEWINKEGTVVYIRESARATRDTDGKTLYYDGTVEDITKLKSSEAILKKLNAELTKSNAEKDKFFSIIAHDLKAPFLGFLGLTQEIVKNAGDISIRELTQMGMTMYQAADNLFKLLQNLLEWAQLQSGTISIEPKDIMLMNLIAKNIEMMKNRIEQKEISIINMVTDPINAYADEKMINSILLNLLSNAVKFTNRSGTITVNAKEIEDQMIEISIKDTGVGIPKSMVEKLFKVGAKTGRKGTRGELSTGLGLLLCKEFVERNDGKIWVVSKENIGSTFSFTLRSRE
jgi:PAS domain S-box-containing protein